MIALEAIWAAKLRSFMTVLGNIVAVTSIIAVVSLIQGLNASVKEAIVSQAGADSFNIQQYPGHQERRGVREGPVEPADLAAGRARNSPLRQPAHRRRHGRRQRAGPRHVSRPIDRQRPGSGRDGGLHQLLRLRRRTRPADDADRSGHGAAGHRARLADGRPAVRHRNRPARKDHPDRRHPLPRRRREREERIAPRPIAGRVRPHPARPVPDAVRIAPAARS